MVLHGLNTDVASPIAYVMDPDGGFFGANKISGKYYYVTKAAKGVYLSGYLGYNR